MRIYLGIKFHADQSNRRKIEALCKLMKANGHQPSCIVQDIEKWGRHRFEPPELMQRTFDVIDNSDLVLIDLSEKGVGLGIEAGYARAKGIRIITIAQAGSDISETIRGISQRVYEYRDTIDLNALFATLR